MRSMKKASFVERNREIEDPYKRVCDALKNSDGSVKQNEVVEKVIKENHSVLTQQNEEKKFYGQKPLHIAICRDNPDAVKLIMKELTAQELLDHKATGKKFQKTTMMGEVPFIVAALTLNPSECIFNYFLGATVYSLNFGTKTI